MNKITCICLGVKSMERAIKFYGDGLGYKTDCMENNPSVCFFDTPGTKFELYPLDLLAKDIDENNPPQTGNGFGGITLTYNVENKNDVSVLNKSGFGDHRMEIRLAEIKDIDGWMQLVNKVKDSFPGLETEEALNEHRGTVLDFISKKAAICAITDNKIVGSLLF